MPQLQENIFNNIDFEAFENETTKAVKDAIEKYWEKDVTLSLQSINNFRELKEEKTLKGMDFFSSRISVENHKPVVIRLSKGFVHCFLDNALLYESQPFRLENMTKLELKILNNFCEFVYKKLKTILMPSSKTKLTENSDETINIIYIVAVGDKTNARVVISIPKDRIPFKTLTKKANFKDEDFLTSCTNVKIKAGTSKLTFEELKNLAGGDIILLENSIANKLILISGEVEQPFNIKINPALILNIDEDSEDSEDNYDKIDNEVIMEKNLWDDIQIEVSAEFEKIKMTIGELKQITQGQIVDLGSVFDNEISLFVEDKKVAKGELLIVNNRYAVKLNKVIAPNGIQKKPEPPKEAPKAPVQKQPAKPNPPIKPQQPVVEEEFDYSDFEK